MDVITSLAERDLGSVTLVPPAAAASRVFDPVVLQSLYGSQPGKFGAWAGTDFQMSFWYLEPRQKMVPLLSRKATLAYVVLQGRGSLHVLNSRNGDIESLYSPDAASVVVPPKKAEASACTDARIHELAEKSVVIVPPETLHYVHNETDGRIVLLAFSAPESLHDVYMAR
jgi:hypothetical protein